MTGIFKKDASLKQKIAAVAFFSGLLGCLFALVSHSFVASKSMSHLAFYISLVSLVWATVLIAYLIKSGKIDVQDSLIKKSKIKQILYVPLMLIALYGFFWLNFNLTIPQLINHLIGEISVIHDFAKKSKSSKSCRYRLYLESNNGLFFYYCISQYDYEKLPATKIPVMLTVKKSKLGIYIKAIDFNNEL